MSRDPSRLIEIRPFVYQTSLRVRCARLEPRRIDKNQRPNQVSVLGKVPKYI